MLDPATGAILERRLGSKAVSVRAQAGGGTATLSEVAAGSQALPDAQILELAGLGQRIAALYGGPQDIEWAWAGGKLSILQAWPITSLFPLPDRVPAEPLQVWLSFAAVQGVLDPLTPAGQDAITAFVASGGRMLGYRTTPRRTRRPSSRPPSVSSSTSRRSCATPSPGRSCAACPASSSRAASKPSWRCWTSRPSPRSPPHLWRTLRHLLPAVVPLAARVLFSLLRPDHMRARAFRRADELNARFAAEMRASQGLAARLAVIDRMLAIVPPTLKSHVIP